MNLLEPEHQDCSKWLDLAHQPAYLVFVFFLLGQLLVASVLQYFHRSIGLILSELLILALPVVFLCWGANYRPLSFLFLNVARWRQVFWGLLLGISNFMIAGALQVIMRSILPSSWSQAFDTSKIFQGLGTVEIFILFIALIVAAPLCEEIAFRGYLQRVLQARYRDYFAVVITAVLFAALHFDPVGFLARVELGVVFGLLVRWSGSLWPAITAHATNNALASAIFLAASQPVSNSPAPVSLIEILKIVFFAGISALIVLFLLRSLYKERTVSERLPESIDPSEDHSFKWSRVFVQLDIRRRAKDF